MTAAHISANKLQGPADLYDQLLGLKNGFADGSTLGCYSITKGQAKAAGVEWSFVVQSVGVLGLEMSNRHGRHGHSISCAA